MRTVTQAEIEALRGDGYRQGQEGIETLVVVHRLVPNATAEDVVPFADYDGPDDPDADALSADEWARGVYVRGQALVLPYHPTRDDGLLALSLDATPADAQAAWAEWGLDEGEGPWRIGHTWRVAGLNALWAISEGDEIAEFGAALQQILGIWDEDARVNAQTEASHYLADARGWRMYRGGRWVPPAADGSGE